MSSKSYAGHPSAKHETHIRQLSASPSLMSMKSINAPKVRSKTAQLDITSSQDHLEDGLLPERVIRRNGSVSSLFSVFRSISGTTSSARRDSANINQGNNKSSISASSAAHTYSQKTTTGSQSASSSGSVKNQSLYSLQEHTSSSLSLRSFRNHFDSNKSESDTRSVSSKRSTKNQNRHLQPSSDILHRRRHLAAGFVKRAASSQQYEVSEDRNSNNSAFVMPIEDTKDRLVDDDAVSLSSTTSSARWRKISQKMGSGLVRELDAESQHSHKSATKTMSYHKSSKNQSRRRADTVTSTVKYSPARFDENSCKPSPLDATSELDQSHSKLNRSKTAMSPRSQSDETKRVPLAQISVPQLNKVTHSRKLSAEVRTRGYKLEPKASSVSLYYPFKRDIDAEVFLSTTQSNQSMSLASSSIKPSGSSETKSSGVCWIGEHGLSERAGFLSYMLDESSDEEGESAKHQQQLRTMFQSSVKQTATISTSRRSSTSLDCHRNSRYSTGSMSIRRSVLEDLEDDD
ncbi:uncharacterized protein V1516DRAFT_672456 [Lipomyces oligophaga]|uniref:uncharacterized protein n=1 Tax=Lipomyces oligophaga TaxID=45792 RepID=UPI0034CEA32A